jgi:hypothetical protein
MSDTIKTFFDAWSVQDAEARTKMCAGAIAASFSYADPRGFETSDLNDLSVSIGEFAKMGWKADVVDLDNTGKWHRATVSFNGLGPDGTQAEQMGTYFVGLDAQGKIELIIGFKGGSKPE